MAIDLKKMRAKLDTLQNRGGDKKSNFWRPKDGEQTLRIVPTADGDPFKDPSHSSARGPVPELECLRVHIEPLVHEPGLESRHRIRCLRLLRNPLFVESR